MKWIRSVHPPTTIEQWIKENKYDGRMDNLLKRVEDGVGKVRRNGTKVSSL